jgi:hypothetical protein
MSATNAQRAGEGAPHQTSEIVGGYSDVVILAVGDAALNAIERDCYEREYELRLRSIGGMASQLGTPFEQLWLAVRSGEIPCAYDSTEQLRFDPVTVEIRLREQSRAYGDWGDSEPTIPSGAGVSP